MSKSTYSIVLSDEVVKAVDRLAYTSNTSRSGMINHILASHLSMVTPEMRLNDIFDTLFRAITAVDDNFRVRQRPSPEMMLLCSPLQYKYKPTLRYSLQLVKVQDNTLGRLRVEFRTQSDELKYKLTEFISLWIKLEESYLLEYFPEGITYDVDYGRFTRTFRQPSGSKPLSDAEIGQAIAQYIAIFDEILKLYFNARDNVLLGEELMRRKYREYVKKGIVII